MSVQIIFISRSIPCEWNMWSFNSSTTRTTMAITLDKCLVPKVGSILTQPNTVTFAASFPIISFGKFVFRSATDSVFLNLNHVILVDMPIKILVIKQMCMQINRILNTFKIASAFLLQQRIPQLILNCEQASKIILLLKSGYLQTEILVLKVKGRATYDYCQIFHIIFSWEKIASNSKKQEALKQETDDLSNGILPNLLSYSRFEGWISPRRGGRSDKVANRHKRLLLRNTNRPVGASVFIYEKLGFFRFHWITLYIYT